MDVGRTTQWSSRALPSIGAARTADAVGPDHHELRADLVGMGHALGEPHRLLVACLPIPTVDDPDGLLEGLGEQLSITPRDRWPTLEELLTAADHLAPGVVFSLVFVAAPEGVERIEPELGEARVLEASQVGAVKTPTYIMS